MKGMILMKTSAIFHMAGSTPVVSSPAGSPPAFPNTYVLFWSVLNILIAIAIVALIVWYLKKLFDYRKQVLSKLDALLSLLQPKNSDDQ